MKHLCYLLVCMTLINAQAQKPEPIYANARAHKSITYYREQLVAWKKVVDANPKDPNAWYNYYYVNRNLLFNDTMDNRPWQEKNAAIQKIITDMGAQVPESYEYNLCKWMAGGFDMSLLPYLKKAAELGEGRTEHLDFMINIGEIDRKPSERNLYAKKKFEAGQISTGMMYYNNNVIRGLAPNAILITTGDNDTYPVWVLQAQGIRKDVTIINLNLIQIDTYRAKLFDELGIAPWNPSSNATPEDKKAARKRFENDIVKHIAANKKQYPVYVGLTTAGCGPYTPAIQENLYLTGLAYLYSQGPVDNIALMKRNFEQLYTLDYIDHAFYLDISPELVKLINQNYEVPMLTLFDHYKTAGDSLREDWVRQMLLAISKDTPDEQSIKTHVAH